MTYIDNYFKIKWE